jgi:hypothetical protein
VSEPQRIPIRHPAKQPRDGVLNIGRDVLLAEQAYGDKPPTLFPAMTSRARRRSATTPRSSTAGSST